MLQGVEGRRDFIFPFFFFLLVVLCVGGKLWGQFLLRGIFIVFLFFIFPLKKKIWGLDRVGKETLPRLNITGHNPLHMHSFLFHGTEKVKGSNWQTNSVPYSNSPR